MSISERVDCRCQPFLPSVTSRGLTAWAALLLLGCRCATLAPLGTAVEAGENAAPLELKTERAIIFKDGYCLIVKRGAAVTDDRREIHLVFTQRAGEFRNPQPAEAAAPVAIDLPPELTTAASQELFVYNLPKFSLRKGERAAVPVYSTQAPYQDVYTWDVQVKRSDIATAPSGSGVGSPLALATNEVWRQIQLTNTGAMPWTTGAAMIMQGGQPLAQELLTYTSSKGSCRVPVTVAVDVRGSISTEEVERELQALTWDGNRYAKIRQRAALDVTSFKQQPIPLEISLRFGGRAEQASDGGKITLAPYREDDWNQYRGSPAVNNSSTIRWTLKLEPAKTIRPTVDYHYYARH